MKALWFLAFLHLYSLVFSQKILPKEDFVFEERTLDTIYLVKDKLLEGANLVFHSKKELLDHFKNTNEPDQSYQFTAEELPARYVVNINFVLDNYRVYKKLKNQEVSDSFGFYDWWSLDEIEHKNFLNYLYNEWGISFEIYSNQLAAYPRSYLYVSKTNWEKKLFVDKCNELLKTAFDEQPPFIFTNDGINFQEFKSIFWEDVKSILVKRASNKLIIETQARNFEFIYLSENYAEIADFHVNFLAGFSLIQSEK